MKKENSSFNVYVLGNPLLEEDSLPLRLLPRLKKEFPSIHFIEMDPTENFPEEDPLWIVDTILNAQNVVVWTDVNAIRSSPSYSLHDFDLGMALKLMRKLGKLKRVTIFGVPPAGDLNKIGRDLSEAITNSLRESASRS